MLSLIQRVFFGPLTNPENRKLADLNVRETVALAPLVVLVFIIGLFPKLLVGQMGPATEGLIERYHAGRTAYLDMSPEAREAVLLPRLGGPLERGYPERPVPPAGGARAERTPGGQP
jgi:NADH-quinone oxidoreductase subunit M